MRVNSPCTSEMAMLEDATVLMIFGYRSCGAAARGLACRPRLLRFPLLHKAWKRQQRKRKHGAQNQVWVSNGQPPLPCPWICWSRLRTRCTLLNGNSCCFLNSVTRLELHGQKRSIQQVRYSFISPLHNSLLATTKMRVSMLKAVGREGSRTLQAEGACVIAHSRRYRRPYPMPFQVYPSRGNGIPGLSRDLLPPAQKRAAEHPRTTVDPSMDDKLVMFQRRHLFWPTTLYPWSISHLMDRPFFGY